MAFHSQNPVETCCGSASDGAQFAESRESVFAAPPEAGSTEKPMEPKVLRHNA
ncbi:MAG: hypothetical protein QM324_00580 [Bacteroidota bacterium]|nr:hypothetical protein [Bacteroidota bacterium]